MENGQSAPDHTTLSRIRSRLPLEVVQEVFTGMLDVVTEADLVHGDRSGVDAATTEAYAALRTIMRKDRNGRFDGARFIPESATGARPASTWIC